MAIHIPQNIKFLLSVNKISRTAIAEVCEVNPVTISHWTAGRQSPKIEQLMRISKFFDISLDDLVGKPLTNNFASKSEVEEPVELYGNRVNLLEELTTQLLNTIKDHDKRITLLEHTS